MRRRLNKLPALAMSAAIFGSVAIAATVGVLTVQALILTAPLHTPIRRKIADMRAKNEE